MLARHFCQQLGTDPKVLSKEVLLRWADYAWPGNVRELRNAVARYIALGELAAMPPETDLQAQGAALSSMTDVESDPVATALALHLPFSEAREHVLRAFERRYVEAILREHDGNVTRAAAASGIGRRYLQVLRAKLADE